MRNKPHRRELLMGLVTMAGAASLPATAALANLSVSFTEKSTAAVSARPKVLVISETLAAAQGLGQPLDDSPYDWEAMDLAGDGLDLAKLPDYAVVLYDFDPLGHPLLNRIRRAPKAPPIIPVLPAYARNPSTEERKFLTGFPLYLVGCANGLLVKPLSHDEMLIRIEAVLSLESRLAANAKQARSAERGFHTALPTSRSTMEVT
jgi:DNA-binding response OmpR family regulator